MDILTAPHIAISQEVAGGKPRIAGHRITVQHIVIWHERIRPSPGRMSKSGRRPTHSLCTRSSH